MNFDVVEMISRSDTFVLEMCASLCVCQGDSILSRPRCINRSAVHQHLQLALVIPSVFLHTLSEEIFSGTLISWMSPDLEHK